MAVIVADTDVLIDALRGAEPSAAKVASAIEAGTLATTVVTQFELLSGARTATEKRKVDRLLGPLSILPLDEAAAATAAELRRGLEAAGHGIGTADYLIAGICLRRSCSLLTRNREHFERVPGLALA